MIEWTMSEKQTNEMLSFCKERYNLLIKGVYYGQNMISEILVWTQTGIATERKKKNSLVCLWKAWFADSLTTIYMIYIIKVFRSL